MPTPAYRAAPAALVPLPLVTLALLLAASPWWFPRVGLYPYLALEITIWMIYAQGYNLLLGHSGLPSFGHGAFFGVGAYAFGLLQKGVTGNLWLDLAGAILAAALAGAVVGAFISHRRGIYYALLTIAFGQVFWFVAIKWHSVTGGEDGLLNLKRPVADLGFAEIPLKSNDAMVGLCVVALVLVVWFCWRFVHSPLGRVLACIRQNEMRARFLGYRVWICKWLVFVVSAAIAGLAGALFAMAQQSAYPNVMSLHQSGFVVMMVLVGGGLTSFWGPLIGAAFFILARDLLGAYTETWLLWYGLLFMAVVLWKPEGLAGIFGDIVRRRAGREALMALFAAQGLHKRFGDRVVLERIDLAFDAGTLTGIMGPNGAGKTTCFNLLTGHYAPDRGRVLLDGADIGGLSPAEIARRGVARSFQAINLFDQETALDNVIIALPEVRARTFDAWRDLARDDAAQDRAAALLARVGLAGRERAKAKDLAYGERRALEIALALATGPRILFLDEPTSGLGADGTARLADLVADLKRTLTLVVIEHDMRFLFALADALHVIHWGQVIASGTPDELRGNPWVQRSALGAA